MGKESPLESDFFLGNKWSTTEALNILGIGISPRSRLL
jgi:hypothetical protein